MQQKLTSDFIMHYQYVIKVPKLVNRKIDKENPKLCSPECIDVNGLTGKVLHCSCIIKRPQ